MKKIYLFLFITCFISIHSMEARSTAEAFEVPVETSITMGQYDLEVIINALEDLGFEVEKLEVVDTEEEKRCKITLKGTYKGEEIDLTIIIEGQTCAEFFKSLL